MARLIYLCLFSWVLLVGGGGLYGQDPELRADALRTLKAAGTFYHDDVSSHGGYVYYYRVDLTERWGEGRAPADTIFVQPPGTPTVGMAYLAAYEATGDGFYRDAAADTAEALIYGQLESGGWTQVIHFGPAERLGNYRHRKGGDWNNSSLDDGQTQAALQFLMCADQALDFRDAKIHEAAQYGLDALLAAQFANGGFPQVWSGPVEPRPIVAARFPGDDWRTEGKIKNYWDHYTLNDNLAGTVADTLITAHRVYDDEKYQAALRKLGDFLLLAQMPEPQPGWCQQYNAHMIPIWARKFEPPAISGWESQDVMETLIKIANYTEDRRYVAPIPRALAYYESCLLPDGNIARFYEFKTNKPLYMDSEYRLTYDGSDAPSHYGWKQPARLDEIRKAYQAATAGTGSINPPMNANLEQEVRGIIDALDDRGRWISTYAGERLVGQPKFDEGFRYISSAVFSRNVELLSEYLAQTPRR